MASLLFLYGLRWVRPHSLGGDLLSDNIVLSLTHAAAAEVVLQIISECYPQLQSLDLSCRRLSKLTGFAHLFYLTRHLQSLNLSYNELCRVEELDLIHNLELRELWLEGNPLHGAVESFSACYRLVTYFPTIEKLDGQFFKENLFFEPEEPQPLPQAKEELNDHECTLLLLSESMARRSSSVPWTCAQILNDQMVILNAYGGPQETPSLEPPKPVPAICEKAPSAAARDTVHSFSAYTRMKPDWALKCLDDNNWDVHQAKKVFHHLKSRGAIPPEAFEVKALAAAMSG